MAPEQPARRAHLGRGGVEDELERAGHRAHALGDAHEEGLAGAHADRHRRLALGVGHVGVLARELRALLQVGVERGVEVAGRGEGEDEPPVARGDVAVPDRAALQKHGDRGSTGSVVASAVVPFWVLGRAAMAVASARASLGGGAASAAAGAKPARSTATRTERRAVMVPMLFAAPDGLQTGEDAAWASRSPA